MKRLTTTVAIVITLLASTLPAAAQDAPTAAAAKASADAWLVLTDADKFAESYAAASPDFRTNLTAAKWSEMGKALRAQLGSVVSRTPTAAQPVPGSPSDYGVEYETVFSGGKLTESVFLRKQADGSWQVVGWFFK